MVGFLLATLIQAASSADPSTLQVEKAKTLLSSFGVKGTLKVKVDSPPDMVRRGPGLVVLNDSRNRPYSVYFMPGTGKIYAAFRGKESDDYPKLPTHVIQDAKLERKVRSWVSLVTASSNARFEGFQVSTGGLAGTRFTLLKNGYPFLAGNIGFCYVFAMTVPEGEFVSMKIYDNVPPVDPRPAVVTLDQAINAMENFFKSQAPPQMVADHLRKPGYKITAGAALGYANFHQEKVSHLVWMIPYVVDGQSGPTTKYTRNRVFFVDAVTGKTCSS